MLSVVTTPGLASGLMLLSVVSWLFEERITLGHEVLVGIIFFGGVLAVRSVLDDNAVGVTTTESDAGRLKLLYSVSV